MPLQKTAANTFEKTLTLIAMILITHSICQIGHLTKLNFGKILTEKTLSNEKRQTHKTIKQQKTLSYIILNLKTQRAADSSQSNISRIYI